MNNQDLDRNDTTIKTKKKSLKDRCVGIYGLKNKTTNKWYIGQSRDVFCRLSKYKNLNCKRQHKIYNALNKYGFSDFDFILIETCELDQDVLNERESYWINFYNSVENGYNLKSGGSNIKYSKDSIEKMRLLKIGRARSKETSEKISRSLSLKYSSDKDHRMFILNRIPNLTNHRKKLQRSKNPNWGIRQKGKKFRVKFKEENVMVYKSGFNSLNDAIYYRDNELLSIINHKNFELTTG